MTFVFVRSIHVANECVWHTHIYRCGMTEKGKQQQMNKNKGWEQQYGAAAPGIVVPFSRYFCHFASLSVWQENEKAKNRLYRLLTCKNSGEYCHPINNTVECLWLKQTVECVSETNFCEWPMRFVVLYMLVKTWRWRGFIFVPCVTCNKNKKKIVL